MGKFLLFSFLITVSSYAWPIKEQVLFTENDPVSNRSNQKWTKLASTHKESLLILLEVLKKSSTAKSIIEMAETKPPKWEASLST